MVEEEEDQTSSGSTTVPFAKTTVRGARLESAQNSGRWITFHESHYCMQMATVRFVRVTARLQDVLGMSRESVAKALRGEAAESSTL